jgi:demethylspheroidene O-methyltransferase
LTLAAAPDLAAREAPDRIALHGHGLETAHPRTRLIDCWIDWRNRLLSDPRFQRWAADFPLTRPIARSRAKGLFDLVAGFVYSQTLAACVRLDLFPILGGGPPSGWTSRSRRRRGCSARRRLCGWSSPQAATAPIP